MDFQGREKAESGLVWSFDGRAGQGWQGKEKYGARENAVAMMYGRGMGRTGVSDGHDGIYSRERVMARARPLQSLCRCRRLRPS